ncbi:succinate dehydrogenase / fumarate reductase cytochrome b subunit [Friedmanniella endophytica]|uniref:Succinate dehydrogenase / fumarate reductase cytochrome b subunit n=2 Tax=Microlunatus kandeliicorticis TaxID=1759536 RepID=A0A7W3IUX3_9ACTN|nr:succinate dehydrogenase / fumarate reductase cytochrome b subunit [Microlunatus kandeliicorticis]
MATMTLTAHQRAARSTVVLKVLMAVSGVIMILFLLAHMYGNLKAYAGAQAFNDYSHHLRTIGEPILPYGGALWVIRVVLVAAVLAHMFSAFRLWARSTRARGGVQRYHSPKAKRGVQRTYASFTLRWGGIVIILFVIFHLLQLTFGVVNPGGPADTPYGRLVAGFQVWWVVLAYTVALLAVGFHLRHGVWSALTTLGANASALARKRLNILAHVVTAIITIGFLSVPYSIVFGLVK